MKKRLIQLIVMVALSLPASAVAGVPGYVFKPAHPTSNGSYTAASRGTSVDLFIQNEAAKALYELIGGGTEITIVKNNVECSRKPKTTRPRFGPARHGYSYTCRLAVSPEMAAAPVTLDKGSVTVKRSSRDDRYLFVLMKDVDSLGARLGRSSGYTCGKAKKAQGRFVRTVPACWTYVNASGDLEATR